jgi:WD40 repeat protein
MAGVATGKIAIGSRFKVRNAMYNAKNQTSLPDPVMCIAWSTDNTRIAFGGWDQVYVWNSATGADENIFREYRELGGTVSWSPDGTRIAAGCSDLKGNAVVAIWDATTGNRITSIIHSSPNFLLVPPQALAWSPDNAAIAVGMIDHMVEVWKVIDGIKRINSYKGNVGGVTAVAWSPHGEFVASSSDDGTVRTWNASLV